ncbi:MAG: GPR endopeptidase [Clostridia bacterium]|nr:GPR endopeptidase [Clostridia bacterium]
MPTRIAPAPSSPTYCRTDLACESTFPATEAAEAVLEIGGRPVTLTRRKEADGGRSVTLSLGRITERGEKDLSPLSELLAQELTCMASALLGRTPDPRCRILVAGLGNPAMTPDAIGPGTVTRMTVTRHLLAYDQSLFAALGCCELSAISPGVLGQTGMEAAELVKCAAGLVKPHLIVAVDALAAADCERLSSTVQLSDSGISPGAGIGNRRAAINAATMACPVIGVGIPTVVDSSTLVWDALARAGMSEESLPPELTEVLTRGRSFIVSPKDCDEVVTLSCRLLAMSLDRAFGVGEM